MSFPKPFYRWRPHPWHGLSAGPDAPDFVSAFIEITPFDTIKYEIDKETGYMRVDRPQRTSSLPPALYGFIPRTFCGDGVHRLAPGSKKADEDPLDICVISERPINRNECILKAKVVGVIKMLDGDEADDKIIAVLYNDNIWSQVDEVSQLPDVTVMRLEHYFATYKNIPGEKPHVSINGIEGAAQAKLVIRAAMRDYEDHYGG